MVKWKINTLLPFCEICSSANAKKWETELQTLKNNNARLTAALQESTANVEEWKKQLNAYKEENIKLRKKVGVENALCSAVRTCVVDWSKNSS